MQQHILSTRNCRAVARVALTFTVATCACIAMADAADVQTPEFPRLWDYSKLEGRQIKWTAEIGHRSGPMTVTQNRVIVGTVEEAPGPGGELLCFHAEDGRLLWKATHPRMIRSGHDNGSGVRSKPRVEGDRVYYVSNRGELMFLDLDGFDDDQNDGPYQLEDQTDNRAADVVWKLDMVGDLNVLKMDGFGGGNPISSPLVIDDTVYCVTGNGCTFHVGAQFGKGLVPRPNAPSFIAVDKYQGAVNWQSARPQADVMYSWSSPVSAEIRGTTQVIFPGGDGRLYAFDPKDGELLWQVDCNETSATAWTRSRRGTRNFFVATPTVDRSMLFVGLNHDTESLPKSAPLYAIDLDRAAGGEDAPMRWRFQDAQFEGTYSAAAVSGDVVFAFSEQTGTLFALDRNTGRKHWQAQLPNFAVESFGSPTVHEDKLYVPTLSSVYVFAAANRCIPIGKYKFERTLHGDPVIVDDTLYVTTSGTLTAVRLEE